MMPHEAATLAFVAGLVGVGWGCIIWDATSRSRRLRRFTNTTSRRVRQYRARRGNFTRT